jgi:hypothetical protein
MAVILEVSEVEPLVLAQQESRLSAEFPRRMLLDSISFSMISMYSVSHCSTVIILVVSGGP